MSELVARQKLLQKLAMFVYMWGVLLFTSVKFYMHSMGNSRDS